MDATKYSEDLLKQGKVGAPGDVITPGPGSTPGSSPLVERYSTPALNPLQQARAELDKQLKQNTEAPNSEAIREEIRKSLQPQVDATNKYYEELKAREVQAGAVRQDKTRGINVRAGLAGSDFASAAATETDKKNQDALGALENERQLKLTAIFDKIDERAMKQAETARILASESAENRVTLLSQIQDEARKNVTEIAKGGFSLDRFKQDPSYKQLLEETGYSSLELDAIYNANLPKKAAKDINYQKIGDSKIVGFWVGDDGTLQKQEYDFEVPAEKDLKIIEGVPYLYDPTTQILEPAKGFTPKPKDTDGTSVGGENPQLYSGLSSKTATAVRAKVTAFKTEPTVQNFAVVQEGNDFAQSLANNTTNPADDQALIYALAKALDPGSVVREGEYATAQKYAQSWVKAYGKGVEQALFGTGFLSEDARKNIKATIKQKFAASKKSYDNLDAQYQQGINALTGRDDGAKFLTDYAIPQATGVDAELEADIKEGGSREPTREALIEKLTGAYPELTKEQIAQKVYTLIPDR